MTIKQEQPRDKHEKHKITENNRSDPSEKHKSYPYEN